MSEAREEVQSHALDIMTEWIGGYMLPETGPQRRVTLVEYDSSSVTIRVETMNPFPSDARLFKISVRPVEVTQE